MNDVVVVVVGLVSLLSNANALSRLTLVVYGSVMVQTATHYISSALLQHVLVLTIVIS